MSVASRVTSIQSIARGFISRANTHWLRLALEDCARKDLFSKNNEDKTYSGWINEWFLHKGFGFIRLAHDSTNGNILNGLPGDMYGPRLTIFCMMSEFYSPTRYPSGKVSFKLCENPKYPDTLMATNIAFNERNFIPIAIHDGTVTSFDPLTRTGVIKYQDSERVVDKTDLSDNTYHVFFHQKNINAPFQQIQNIRAGAHVKLNIAPNPTKPALLTAINIRPNPTKPALLTAINIRPN
jgi:hypothetical protein